LAVAAACTGGGDGSAGGNSKYENDSGLGIEVISSRPEYVTGGDALVAVTLPEGAGAGDVKIEVGGENRTASFAPDPENDGRLLGLVCGLPAGGSELPGLVCG